MLLIDHMSVDGQNGVNLIECAGKVIDLVVDVKSWSNRPIRTINFQLRPLTPPPSQSYSQRNQHSQHLSLSQTSQSILPSPTPSS